MCKQNNSRINQRPNNFLDYTTHSMRVEIIRMAGPALIITAFPLFFFNFNILNIVQTPEMDDC